MDDAPWLDGIFEILLKWQNLGIQRLPDGSRRIGHVPHVAPEAYLHCIPPALSEDEISTLEHDISAKFSPELKAFFRKTNGLETFSDDLGVYGHRKSYQRSDFSMAAAQPYDLRIPNTYERPRWLPSSDMVIGYYSAGDGLAAILRGDGQVHLVRRRGDATVLNRWPSLADWLTSEVGRLAAIYDASGVCIEPDAVLPTPDASPTVIH